MEPVTAMLIGSAISGAGGLVTNWINRKNIQDTNIQREKMFERQLEYNTEGAQMARRMSAGLHPMTMSGANPSEAPTAPDFESFQARNPFAGAIDTGQSLSQIALQEKQLALQGQTLEVQKLNNLVDLMSTMSNFTGQDFTTEEVFDLAKRLGFDLGTDSVPDSFRDSFVLQKLALQIENSQLSNEEKKINLNYLDRLKNLEADAIQSGIDVNETVKRLNGTIADLNEEKKKEVTQAIENLKRQCDLLVTQNRAGQYEANISEQRLKYVRNDAESLSKALQESANVTEKDADLYVTKMLLGTLSQLSPSVGFIKKF